MWNVVPPEKTWAELLVSAERYADGDPLLDDVVRTYQTTRDFVILTQRTLGESVQTVAWEVVAALSPTLIEEPFYWVNLPDGSREPTLCNNAAALLARRACHEVRSSWWKRLRAEVTGLPWRRVFDAERAAQADLLRDIFGNPFNSITFSTEWRTDTAVTLAQQMYESRDFSAMPILADALQDARCDNTDILSHCRDTTQVHVRGCWVVDLVLGKA
jgi:hypothetical protein